MKVFLWGGTKKDTAWNGGGGGTMPYRMTIDNGEAQKGDDGTRRLTRMGVAFRDDAAVRWPTGGADY